MELSQLKIFRAVVQTGGITSAAKKLHRVQSNVTTRIRQLEDELGVQLFIREGKKLHLSPAGKIFLEYVDQILDLSEEAQEAIHDIEPRGILRIEATESAATVFLPAPLRVYHETYPKVKIELTIGISKNSIEKLANNQLDIALVKDENTNIPFEKIPIYKDELVIVAGANLKEINDPSNRSTNTIIAFSEGCINRKILENWFSITGKVPERTIELSSFHTILSCVVAGMGISVVPYSILNTFPQKNSLSIHNLPKSLNTIEAFLVWKKESKSPKVNALIEIIKKYKNAD